MDAGRTKPVEQSIRETEDGERQLRRELSATDLVVLGIGVIVGTGIFVLTGIAAATQAGPAITISFAIGGITCALAALCYAEFASTVPVTGSAYTFSYASLGEIWAWLIGWDLVLEMSLGAATVAKGWSAYLGQGLQAVGITLPETVAGDQAAINIPAALLVLVLTAILIVGVKVSARFNAVVTAIKLAVVALFLGVGAFSITASNWRPFIPPPGDAPTPANATDVGTPLSQLLFGLEPLAFGLPGILFGAAIVFFAYIGFDVVATTAEETRRPQRDLPIGILGSLAVCTVLYMAVSLVLTGMVHYTELNVAAPVAFALQAVGMDWAAGLVSVGAVAGLTTVTLVLLMGQSRVLFAMSRDRLLPGRLATIHPRYRTPARITVLTGAGTALLALLAPIRLLAEMVNIGTLFAFLLVSVGVLVLRRTRPDLPRAFRTPGVPVVPVLAALLCLLLMLNLAYQTWLRFVVWMALGLIVYAGYGYRHSRMAAGRGVTDEAPAARGRTHGR